MLQRMTIRLIHVDQLETLYLCYGVKYESWVIWGHCGQKVVFNKNYYNSTMLHFMTTEGSYMLISLRSSTYVMGSNFNLGSFGVTAATVSRSVYRSSFFLFSSSSSVNISLTCISGMTWPILTRLGHKYRLTIPFMSYDHWDERSRNGEMGQISYFH